MADGCWSTNWPAAVACRRGDGLIVRLLSPGYVMGYQSCQAEVRPEHRPIAVDRRSGLIQPLCRRVISGPQRRAAQVVEDLD